MLSPDPNKVIQDLLETIDRLGVQCNKAQLTIKQLETENKTLKVQVKHHDTVLCSQEDELSEVIKVKDSTIESLQLDLNTLEANALKRISQLEDQLTNIDFKHFKVDIKANSIEDLIVQMKHHARSLEQRHNTTPLDINDVWTLGRLIRYKEGL